MTGERSIDEKDWSYESELVAACQMFMVPLTILFAALGVSSTHGLKAGISLVGCATSVVWALAIAYWPQTTPLEQWCLTALAAIFAIVMLISFVYHFLRYGTSREMMSPPGQGDGGYSFWPSRGPISRCKLSGMAGTSPAMTSESIEQARPPYTPSRLPAPRAISISARCAIVSASSGRFALRASSDVCASIAIARASRSGVQARNAFSNAFLRLK